MPYKNIEDRIINQKQYRSEHPGYMKEYNKKYYQDNREILLGHVREYRENNLEHIKEYREKNKENISEYNKEYHQKNKEKRNKQTKYWFENHPEYIRIWAKTEKGKANHQRGYSKRQAREKRILNTLTAEEWLFILKKYDYRCVYCGKDLLNLFDRPTRDHIIPISKGGDNIKENIIPACRSCNSKKHDKLPDN